MSSGERSVMRVGERVGRDLVRAWRAKKQVQRMLV